MKAKTDKCGQGDQQEDGGYTMHDHNVWVKDPHYAGVPPRTLKHTHCKDEGAWVGEEDFGWAYEVTQLHHIGTIL